MARSKVRLVWNKPEFERIARDPAVKAELIQIAEKIARRCGPGYLAVSGEGRTRSRAAVITTTLAAIKDNAEHNTILRNIGDGG